MTYKLLLNCALKLVEEIILFGRKIEVTGDRTNLYIAESHDSFS